MRAGLVVVAAFVAFLGWGDRSASSTVELADDDLLIVNVAGPVTLRSSPAGDSGGATATATVSESWLWSRPEISASSNDGRGVLQVRCPGRGPCRAALDVVVPAGADVVVIAGAAVTVTRFDGSLTVLAADGPVALGPVSGSARVVSAGPIDGHGLLASALDLSSSDDVALTFDTAPDSVVLAGANVRVEVPDDDYLVSATANGAVDSAVVSDDDASSRLVLDASGDLVLSLAEDR